MIFAAYSFQLTAIVINCW